MTTTDAPLYGDKTLAEWDQDWHPVPEGLKSFQDDLKYLVGLYRVMHNGRVLLIGVGTAEHGALAKRLSDYRRPSPSGRRCRSGQYVYENRNDLKVEVIVVGAAGDKESVQLSKELKKRMIERHKPAKQGSYRARPPREPKPPPLKVQTSSTMPHHGLRRPVKSHPMLPTNPYS